TTYPPSRRSLIHSGDAAAGSPLAVAGKNPSSAHNKVNRMIVINPSFVGSVNQKSKEILPRSRVGHARRDHDGFELIVSILLFHIDSSAAGVSARCRC